MCKGNKAFFIALGEKHIPNSHLLKLQFFLAKLKVLA